MQNHMQIILMNINEVDGKIWISQYAKRQGRHHRGGKGGKSPPKDFKKGEKKKIWGIFMHQSY